MPVKTKKKRKPKWNAETLHTERPISLSVLRFSADNNGHLFLFTSFSLFTKLVHFTGTPPQHGWRWRTPQSRHLRSFPQFRVRWSVKSLGEFHRQLAPGDFTSPFAIDSHHSRISTLQHPQGDVLDYYCYFCFFSPIINAHQPRSEYLAADFIQVLVSLSSQPSL